MKDKNMSGVALTLEQLRKMNGQPVYWGTAKHWFIVQLGHPDFGDCVINAAGYYLPLEKAASRRFYAHQPLHISREKWEPCKLCKRRGEVDPCHKNGCFKENAPQCSYSCDKFLEWRKVQRRLHDAKFCPECGRPLTDEAWAELQKRLEDAGIGDMEARALDSVTVDGANHD